MKVLLATGRIAPESCGVGDYTVALARALAAAGDDITLVAATGNPHDAGVPTAMLRDWTLRSVPQLWRLLRRVRPDIVHVQYPAQGYHGGGASKLIPLLSRLAGATVVETWHEQWYPRQAPDLAIKALPAAGLVFVRWNYLDNFAASLRWALRGKALANIPNASTLAASTLSDDERLALRGRTMGGQSRLIVFFGVISDAKQPELVLDLADPATDFVLFAGQFADGAVESRMRALAAQPEWLDKVRFAGRLSDVEAADLLAAADAIVLPFREGAGPWSSSLHASAAQGSFVLTTTTGASHFDAERNVFYAQLDDHGAMREALRRHAGLRSRRGASTDAWAGIAASHRSLYARLRAVRAPATGVTAP